MPTTPAINAIVTVTAKDINGNSVAKIFRSVTNLEFNYSKGIVKVYDTTGQFIFSLLGVTTLTYTVVAGVEGATTVVMS